MLHIANIYLFGICMYMKRRCWHCEDVASFVMTQYHCKYGIDACMYIHSKLGSGQQCWHTGAQLLPQ